MRSLPVLLIKKYVCNVHFCLIGYKILQGFFIKAGAREGEHIFYSLYFELNLKVHST
jgi:hypothetical protein